MFRMRHFVYLSLLMMLAFCRAHAQTPIYDCYNGSSEQGGNRLTVNGIQTNQYAVQSWPGTTVTVYIHNTLTLATLFQDEAGLVPLSNPFSSSSHGVAFVCTADGRYDFKYSGTTISVPFTVSDIKFCFACSGGGGGSGTVNGTPPHVAKFISPTAVGDSSGLDPGNTPTQWPLGLNVIGNAGYLQKTAGTGGVVANELTEYDTSGNAIVSTVGSSAVRGVADIGVALGAAFPEAVWGSHAVVVDNQTAVNDFACPSTSTAGLASDVGASQPNNCQIIGRFTSANTGAGTLANIELPTTLSIAPGSTGGSGTVSPCPSSNSVAFYQTPGIVINCDNLHTDDAIGHVTAKTLGLTDTTSAGFWWWVNGPLPPAPPANSVQLIAPVSIGTSYTWTLPSAITGTGSVGGCLSIASLTGAVATIDIVPCSGGGGAGTVTSVAAGTGLAATPSPITTTGTLRIADTAVTPGSCTNCDLTINQQGQIIAQANGSSGGTGTVTSVGLSLPSIFTVTGTPVTTSGTLGATFNVPGADYLPTGTAANVINWEQINAGADCGDGTHAVSYSTSTHKFGCQTLTTGGSGSVTSVGLSINGGSSSGIFAATGTPVTTSGTLNYNLTGTSGGFPYFSNGSILSSTALMTANNPIIGGGAGTAPSSGARSGNTTTFGTTSGSLTNGDVAKFDASGNIVDGGSFASAAGNCNSGAAMCYYPLNDSGGTAVNKIAKWTAQGANNGKISTTVTGDGSAGVSVPYAGVVVTGAGTTGTATVAFSGTVSCLFDATAPIHGDSVEISSTVAGTCHDMGVQPANENPDTHYIIGVVESASGGASAVNTVDLQPIATGFGLYAPITQTMTLLATSPYGGVQAVPSALGQTGSTIKAGSDLILGNYTGLNGFRWADPSNSAFFTKIRQCGTGGTCGAGSHDFLFDIDTGGFDTTASLRINGNYYSIPQAKGTTSGTVTLFTSAADEQTITMNGDTTLVLDAAKNAGEHFTVHVCQDGTGGRKLTWPTTMIGHGIMPAAASACLTQGFIYNDSGAAGVPATARAIATPVVLTSQTAAITTTTLASVTADSTYRVTATLNCDTSSAAATVNITIGWTDTSNTAQTAALGSAVVCTSLGSSSVGNLTVAFRAKSGTNITYATSIVNTPTYDAVISNPETISIN